MTQFRVGDLVRHLSDPGQYMHICIVTRIVLPTGAGAFARIYAYYVGESRTGITWDFENYFELLGRVES